MAFERRWAAPPARRGQFVLIPETVDDLVPADHPVRLVDACLAHLDWTPWAARYPGRRGQPPIHPRVLAGALLYGSMRGVRSSRELEDAARHRIDFIWLLEGFTPDHSTFAAFRTAFGRELKALNRQLAEAALRRCGSGLASLVLDGTRMRADSDRYGTRTAAGLERLVQDCVAELNRKLAEMAAADARDAGTGPAGPAGDEPEDDAEALRREVAALAAKRERLERALAAAEERDRVRKTHHGQDAKPVQVPATDPDAQVLPNKEGGFAPNYTPLAGVDADSGVVVYENVPEGNDECGAVLPAVDAAETLRGRPPDAVLADHGFAAGENLEALEARGVTPWMPAGSGLEETDNPAHRPDPTQPVRPADRDRLPKKGKRFSAAAFIYDEPHDCYYCPIGQRLRPIRSGHDRNGVAYTHYQCPGAAGCPLAGHCVKAGTPARTLRRDRYQSVRERTDRRMATEAGRTAYARRAPIAEGVFAHIKHHMRIRRFLLRGLAKVRTEWTWICTAFNLKRLIRPITGGKPHPPPPRPAHSRTRPTPNAYRLHPSALFRTRTTRHVAHPLPRPTRPTTPRRIAMPRTSALRP